MLWLRLSKNLSDPALAKYFEKSVGMRFWQQEHLILPVLIFGSFPDIDKDELQLALEMIDQFLSTVEPEHVSKVVQSIHGFVSGTSFFAVELAQLFARLYLNFKKSGTASLVCFTKYRACLLSATYAVGNDINWAKILAPCPIELPALLVSKKSVLEPFSISNYDWPMAVDDEVNLCVALNILRTCVLRQKALRVPPLWLPWLTSELNSHIGIHDLDQVVSTDISLGLLAAPDDCSLSVHSFYQDCIPCNFTISIEGGPVRQVRDWYMAASFPYFAKAIAAGMGEAESKNMVLSSHFPTPVLDAIIAYSEGEHSHPNILGKPFELRPLSVTDYESGVEAFEEYGIFGLPKNIAGQSEPKNTNHDTVKVQAASSSAGKSSHSIWSIFRFGSTHEKEQESCHHSLSSDSDFDSNSDSDTSSSSSGSCSRYSSSTSSSSSDCRHAKRSSQHQNCAKRR